MTAATALARGRTAAETLMVDRCTVRRPDRAEPVRDPVTGDETFPTPTVFESACKVQRYDGQTSTESGVAGRVVTVDRLAVHLPVGSPSVQLDDEITIDASVHEPDLVGRVFRVAMAHTKSWATARRMVVEEVTG